MSGSLAASLQASPATLEVTWQDGTRGEFASIWLRDNRPEDRDSHSGQRLIDVTDIPRAPRIRAAAISGGQARVSWQDEAQASSFALDWLYGCARAQQEGVPGPEPRRWLEAGALDARHDFCWLPWPALRADARARLQWLDCLLRDGIAFIATVPCIDNAILDAVASVGRVLETNYGLLFDVRAVAQPENLAFSDRGLGLHTDNPYREPVPGFQALHTLSAAPDGGDSRFADGLALAEQLRASAPEYFELLARTPVPFRYRGPGADLYAERPLIELSCTGTIAAVAFNNRSIQPLRLPAAACTAFYAAYRHFAELLHEPRFQLSLRLQAGELVVFDNRRVLHGRTGFASARYPRHLQGCYLSRDSVLSAAALLRQASAGGEPA